MRIKYNFVNIFFVENIHGMEQVVKIWQFFSFSLILLRIEKPIQKTIIYKQMKKKKNLPPTFMHRPVTENQLLLPIPVLTLHPPIQKLNQVKYQKVLVFKTFSTCCHFRDFLLYIVWFFSLFIEIFSSMFLTFMILLRILFLMIQISQNYKCIL